METLCESWHIAEFGIGVICTSDPGITKYYGKISYKNTYNFPSLYTYTSNRYKQQIQATDTSNRYKQQTVNPVLSCQSKYSEKTTFHGRWLFNTGHLYENYRSTYYQN